MGRFPVLKAPMTKESTKGIPMSWNIRSGVRACLAAAAIIATSALVATPAAAAEQYVKYYTVTSAYKGAPENLTEIASRFLGSGARSTEIFNLNTSREQPDGAVLTDPARLNAGWMLVMPWDAVGPNIQYGVLPAKAPTAPTKTSPPTAGTPKTTAPTARPSVQPSGAPKPTGPATTGKCAATAASSTRSDWAQLRLAPDQAWPQSRGKGQLVAVIDSGVDGTLKQLTGHVTVGADVASGKGRGDTDCLGSGTAMAALIVAQQPKGGGLTGLAPDATVMPVRVVTTTPQAQVGQEAAAITAAVAAGATVVALGSYVDPTDAGVAKAIADAAAHNAVVVFGAALDSVPAGATTSLGEGVLRVAGVGVDSQPAANYLRGGVDVVAPGVNVGSLGIMTAGAVAGSGTHYAVAFVAGEAALIRAAYPDLNAQQVSHRIKVTSDKMSGSEPPDGQFGWGFINPAVAVTKVLAEEAATAPSASPQTVTRTSSGVSTRTTVLLVTVILMIAAATVLVLRVRRLLLGDADDEPQATYRPAPPTYVVAGSAPPPAGVPPSAGASSSGGGHWTD